MSNLESIIVALNSNPMFHMSLGSKELFHSNFLAFLWNQNHKAFLIMLNTLLPHDKKIDVTRIMKQNDLTLDRERENFDICIYHKKGKSIIYDIVIENKVKSIPFKEQLESYEKKLREHQDVTQNPVALILLSLVTTFPQADVIKNNWNIISYAELAETIRPSDYIKKSKSLKHYIDDYRTFIKLLDALKSDCINNFNDSVYHNNYEIEKFQKIKLKDLYLKLRGAYFISMLKPVLEEKISNVEIAFFKNNDLTKRRRNGQGTTTMIWLDSGINRGKSTITLSINPPHSKNLYELQIEGDQYRHMLNKYNLVERKGKVMQHLAKIYYFVYRNLPQNLQYNKTWDGKTNADFNQYMPDCLYKYVKFSPKTTVNEMKELVLEDIQNIIGYLQECEKKVSNI